MYQAMMTVSRYMCAVVVLVAAALTPSSCSDVAEQAMAFEETSTVVVDAAVLEQLVHRDENEDISVSATDTDETGS